MEEDESSAEMDIHHVFGVRTSLMGAGVSYYENEHIIYSLGRQLCIYNTETHMVRTLPFGEDVQSVGSFSSTYTGKIQRKKGPPPGAGGGVGGVGAGGGLGAGKGKAKTYLAVSQVYSRDVSGVTEADLGANAVEKERDKDVFTTAKTEVCVYSIGDEVHRIRRLSSSDTYGAIYVSLCERNPRYMITVGSDIEHTLMHWNLEKFKVAGIGAIGSDTEVTKATLCPFNEQQILVTGPKYLKLWKYVENALKPHALAFEQQHFQKITDHRWVASDRFVLSTNDGKIFVFDKGDAKTVITSIFPDGNAIRSIERYSKGLVVAGDGGHLAVFEKTKEEDRFYVPVKRVTSSRFESIQSMVLSPEEDAIALFQEDNSIASFPLANIDILHDNEPVDCPLIAETHHGRINDFSVATQKPFLVTCSKDETVRIWNYYDRSCVFTKRMSEEVVRLSVAMHPTAAYVLIGFKHMACIYYILENDLQLLHGIDIKNCRKIRYSNGGDMFAVVSGGAIVLFNAYTLEQIGTLRGHMGPVRSLCWYPDDHKLLTSGFDGAVYEWDVTKLGRVTESEHVEPKFQYMSATYTSGNVVMACGQNKQFSVIRQIEEGNITLEIKSEDFQFTKLSVSRGREFLYAGLSTGVIVCYLLDPKTGRLKSNEPVSRLCVHEGPVKSLLLPFYDGILFSGGDDGIVCCISCPDSSDTLGEERVYSADKTSEVITILKSEMQEKKSAIDYLNNKIAEMEAQHNHTLKQKDEVYNKKIEEIVEEKDEYIRLQQTKYDAMKRLKEETEISSKDALVQMEKSHMSAAEDLMNLYGAKLQAEEKRVQKLMKDAKNVEHEKDEELEILRKEFTKDVDSVLNEYNKKIGELEEEIDELKREQLRERKSFSVERDQVEEEHSKQVKFLLEQHQQDLEKSKMATVNLKGEAVFLRNKFATYKQEQENMKNIVKQKDVQIQQLQRRINEQNEAREMLENEIKQRDQSLTEKEKQINQLKRRNQELEKFRVVFGYKLQSLKKEIEPKEETIEDLSAQVGKMENEFEKKREEVTHLKSTIAQKATQIETLNKQIRGLERKLTERSNYIQKFRNDLMWRVDKADGVNWREEFKRLYREYVLEEDKRAADTALELEKHQTEFERQRLFLQKQAVYHEMKTRQVEKKSGAEFHKRLVENQRMVQEVNTLRKENHDLKTRLQKLQSQLTEFSRTKKTSRSVTITPGSIRPTSRQSTPSTRMSTAATMFRPSSVGYMGAEAQEMKSLRKRAKSAEPTAAKDLLRRPLESERPPPSMAGDIQAMMLALEENNRIIEMQRYEIKRLREQVQILLDAEEGGGERSVIERVGSAELPHEVDGGEPEVHEQVGEELDHSAEELEEQYQEKEVEE